MAACFAEENNTVSLDYFSGSVLKANAIRSKTQKQEQKQEQELKIKIEIKIKITAKNNIKFEIEFKSTESSKE